MMQMNMSLKQKNYTCLIMLIVCILLGGVIHIVFYGVDFFDAINQIYYSSIALIWGAAIKKRIIDKKMRHLLLCMVALILFIFSLQLCRYKLMEDNTNAIRYAWYSYYIPVYSIPCIMYQVSLIIGTKPDNQPHKKRSVFIHIYTFIMILIVMTNDIHQLVFKFPVDLKSGYHNYEYNVGFFINYLCVIILYIATFVTTIKKCKVMAVKKKMWLPLLLAASGGIGEILIITGLLKINGINIWQTGELMFFSLVGFEEACIAIGLIPANTGYKELLNRSNKPIVILDNNNNVIYQSSQTLEAFNSSNAKIYNKKISGGTVSWAIDMSAIYKLNNQIKDTTEQIEMRNEYLITQNDIKKEQAKINTRNELYDNMAVILTPQINEIKEFIKKSDDQDFDITLRKISVLNAYIKRRSNMELLRDGNDNLSLRELFTAIHESCEYIKLCDVEAMVEQVPDKIIPAKMLILAYDYFEKIIENSLNALKSIFITSSYKNGQLRLSLMINTYEFILDGNWYKKEIEEFNGTTTITKEDNDLRIVLILNEGGAK
ncbi:MAG: hypothetical protein MJ172_05230 [Clostridia bacterium]|nr:hypothetical protein [Clostridia bacterium]